MLAIARTLVPTTVRDRPMEYRAMNSPYRSRMPLRMTCSVSGWSLIGPAAVPDFNAMTLQIQASDVVHVQVAVPPEKPVVERIRQKSVPHGEFACKAPF